MIWFLLTICNNIKLRKNKERKGRILNIGSEQDKSGFSV